MWKKLINYLFDIDDEDNIENKNIIDLFEYHYKVDNVYNNLILVDIDVDILNIERFQHVKLLNDVYIVRDIEHLPHNNEFKYRLTLISPDTE